MSLFLRLMFVLLLCLSIDARAISVYAQDAKPVAPDITPLADKDSKKSDKPLGDSDASKKAPEDVSGGRFAGDPVYVHLAPMVMPIINENGVEQLVTIVIDIQVKDFDTADLLHSNMPKVMDTIMRALYGGLGDGNLRNGKLVDITKIKNKTTRALKEVITGDGIKDVLIQGVSQRML